jgi:hypothetical protein
VDPRVLVRDTTSSLSLLVPQLAFLVPYQKLVQRHLNVTVLQHIRQNVWKSLDAPDMLDAPNIDTPVFVRIVDPRLRQSLEEDSGHHDDDDYGGKDRPRRRSPQEQDHTMIVRYRSVERALLEGQVELVL